MVAWPGQTVAQVPGINAGFMTCCDVAVPAGVQRLYLPTTPEVVAGSTRLQAGTATKMALNQISTTLLTRAGRVYQRLMVAVRASNDKLRDRAARIIAELCQVNRQQAIAALVAAEGDVRVAVVMHARHCSREDARQLLQRHQ